MRKILLTLLGFFVFFSSAFFAPAFAESIQNFDVVITANKSGVLFIEETITYDFGQTQRHGIYRYIPLLSTTGKYYKISPVSISRVFRDGKNEIYTISENTNQKQIKIGDPSVLISGVHTYIIDYNVSNIIGNFSDHDEIYWNVTGNGWNVPIPLAQVSVQTNFGLQPDDAICYTGIVGSTASNCTVSVTKNGATAITNSPLLVGEGLTVAVAFPPNTFPKTKLQNDSPQTLQIVHEIEIVALAYFFLNLILAPLLFFWYLKSKYKKRFGKATVNFDIPKGPDSIRLLPAEAGSIDNSKLDKDDIIATIFDLAIKKYITIEASSTKNFLGLGSHTQYSAKQIKRFDDLLPFEKKIAGILFKSGQVVVLNEAKFTYENFSDLEDINFTSLIKKHIYVKNPRVQMGFLLLLGILLTLTLNLILGPLVIFLSRKLNGRTQAGDEIDWKIDGLKIFLQNMSREYKWQAEKAYTVEQMIPYAIALGVIQDFIKQLKILNPNYQPSWYSGTGNFYSAYPFFYSSVGRNIAQAPSSSGSGFSGGFSGGGGGGGGGGSW